MSSTRVYTPLENPCSSQGVGVRITDYDEFESHMEALDGKSVSPLTFTSQEKEGSGYPRTYTEYVYLQGFTAYPQEHDHIDTKTVLKLENFGIEYNKEFFINFWERVATYCDEFSFLHASANHFPSTATTIQSGWPDYLYRISTHEGELQVEKVKVEFEVEEIEL